MFLPRSILFVLSLGCLQFASWPAGAQYYGPPGGSFQRRQPTVARRPLDRPGALRRNEMPVRNTDSMINEVVTPIPLTENRLEAAQEGVDRQIRDLIEDLRPQMRQLFPDKLEALSGTAGWNPACRTALTKALRSGDPEQIYEVWLEAEPNNAAGAERIAREAELQRAFKHLEQSGEEGDATTAQIEDLRDALDKLAVSEEKAGELAGALDELNTWVQIQETLDEAEPDIGAATVLPKGRVKLIKNPNLSVGTAVVLNDSTVMVGSRGHGGVEIARGNAAEALGLPVVNDDPLPDAEGAPQRSGTLIMNPRKYGETIRYVLNGEEYIMRPGTSQRLPTGWPWRIEYDRGANAGVAEYSLSDGTYVWTPTEHGWQLFKQRYDVTIDNTRNPKDFHFVVNDEPMMVRARHTRTVRNAYPIVIEYDRGNGSHMASKAINFSGNVEVGINAEDNLSDMFPEQRNAKRAEEPDLFR
ncbi:MAG TPA: hypothetical protein VNH11_21635 [Pirellulales bacterium]|nr:hypothetical protein [Pirellulales bacterium]